jgi:hypothetical protein
MKILITAIIFIASVASASACGGFITPQSFPTVKMSEFGINSWMVAKSQSVGNYSYDFSVCDRSFARIGTVLPSQKFPSVPLAEFNYNSWMVAK